MGLFLFVGKVVRGGLLVTLFDLRLGAGEFGLSGEFDLS